MMRKLVPVLAGLIIVAAVSCLILKYVSREPILSVTSTLARPAIIQEPPVDAPLEQEVAVSAPAAPRPVIEAVGTDDMIAAHASLRSPELANPDSEGNRQVLQTMLKKALSGSNPPSPVSVP